MNTVKPWWPSRQRPRILPFHNSRSATGWTPTIATRYTQGPFFTGLTMIRSQGVTKQFKGGFLGLGAPICVLKGFDFEARPGEITGLLGPNGAGKTTFFRGVTGLDRMDSGNLEVDGIDPGKHPKALRGRVALLPEEPGVDPHSSGLLHLELFALLQKIPRRRAQDLIAQANADLVLEDFWKRPFRTYSRGQKARIALARLRLMERAQVMIFDEPSNGLDFQSVGRLHAFIRSLAEEGKTVVVSSHILSDLRALCDRLVGLVDGTAATSDQVDAWMSAHARSEGMV